MSTAISLQKIEREIAIVHIKGTAPLITHRWSEKAKKQMLDAQRGVKTPKQIKEPLEDFEAARYKFADGGLDGFPTVGLKKAVVQGAARAFGKSVKMTELRQNLLFLADGLCTDGTPLTRLTYDGEPTMREDMVRVGMGTADLRYRPQYNGWGAEIKVEFDPNLIDVDSVVALIDAGGSNGVGEWRPERNGTFGTFQVVT